MSMELKPESCKKIWKKWHNDKIESYYGITSEFGYYGKIFILNEEPEKWDIFELP